MKKNILWLLSIGMLCSMTACNLSKPEDHKNDNTDDTDYSDVDDKPDDTPFNDQTENDSEFNISTEVSNGYTKDSGIYTITKAGEYTVSGKLVGQIKVEAGEEDEVTIVLNGVSIEYSKDSPIRGITAGKIKIKSVDGTYNIVKDTRSPKTSSEADSALGQAAIYAKSDLNFVGKGTLVVEGGFNHGISTTKDLKIKNTALKSTGYNHSIKGNDSITIESGNIFAIAPNGDGLKTENSDISSKGNQRGTISILGGMTNIYSYGDAIDASYDAVIQNGEDGTDSENPPVVNIYTNKYSDYSEGNHTASSAKFYIRLNSYNYSTNYRWAILCSDGENEQWVNGSYATSIRTYNNTYYYYQFNRPTGFTNFTVYRFASTSTENSTTDYSAKMNDSMTFNSSKDTITVSASGTTLSMSGSWMSFEEQQQNSSGGEANNNKATDSAKGIKAQNNIYIKGGKINAKVYDDGLHANRGTTLENGSTGIGDVVISGGDLTIDASDDGLHADKELTITGGTINIANSYEGVEGNVINFRGGKTTIYATDDGINAANKAGLTPQINFEGGLVDLTIGTGDVDGIDSNGNITFSGGMVITRGAPNTTSSMSSSIDADGTVKMTGGTLVCIGTLESAPTISGSVCCAKFGSSSSTGGRPGPGGGGPGGGGFSNEGGTMTITAGIYKVEALGIEFTIKNTYNGLTIYSDQMTVNGSYTLSGPVSKTWTQSSTTTTIS